MTLGNNIWFALNFHEIINNFSPIAMTLEKLMWSDWLWTNLTMKEWSNSRSDTVRMVLDP